MFVDTYFLKGDQTRLYFFCSISKLDLLKSDYTYTHTNSYTFYECPMTNQLWNQLKSYLEDEFNFPPLTP